MRVAYREFNATRKFGVELEVEQTLTKKELAKIIETYEREKKNPRKAYVEGGDLGGWAESVSNDFWHIKYDSSCGPKGKGLDTGGWEVASYVGSGPKDIDDIASAGDFLGQNTATVNQNCGLHIHVEVKDFTQEQLGVLLAYWLKIEPFIYHACPKHRKDNVYCKSMRSLFYKKSGINIDKPIVNEETKEELQQTIVEKLGKLDELDEPPTQNGNVTWTIEVPPFPPTGAENAAMNALLEAFEIVKGEDKKPKKRKTKDIPDLFTKDPLCILNTLKPKNLNPHDNAEKKVSLNILGYAKWLYSENYNQRVTVELRVPECILDKAHIKNWTCFIVQFVEACKQLPMPADLMPFSTSKEVLEVLGIYSSDEVLVLDVELHQLKLWFLDRVEKFSGKKTISKEAGEYTNFLTTL